MFFSLDYVIHKMPKRILLEHGMRQAPGVWGFGIMQGLLVNLLLILILAAIIYWLLKGSRKAGKTPVDALRMRLARGEIDEEEYRKLKKLLEE